MASASPKTGMLPKLGIVAGGGVLPGYLAQCAQEQGREVFVLAVEGQADPAVVKEFTHAWIRMGAASSAIEKLREEGVEEVVLAGPVRRPSLTSLMPDARAVRFLAKGVFKGGDDGLLGAIVAALEEEEGFKVIAAQDIAGGLLAGIGRLAKARPDERVLADIERGVEVLLALGRADVGQAVVVQNGVVLGIEALEGTDGLITRTADLRFEGPGPVLIKMSKPGQEHRIDLPTIGPGTIATCAQGGFAGIAVEAGMCLIVERDKVIDQADSAGLFLEGWSTAGG